MSSAAGVSGSDASALADWTAGTWTIDPAHTVVAFAARHLMSRVRGTFSEVEGKIVTGEEPPLGSATAVVALSRIGFSASGAIMRRDFGITFGLAADSKIVIGDKVDITLDVQAVLDK